MRLLNLLIHDNDYLNTKHILNKAFKSGQLFVLDANIIIVLAKERDEERLNGLLFDNNFRIYDLTLHEINGLLKAEEFDKETSKILNQFLNEISKNKIIKVPNYKIHRLYELSELLPRKIVHEAMITMEGSWLQMIVDNFRLLYEKFETTNKNELIIEAGKFYNTASVHEFIIKNFIEKAYLNITSKKGIDVNKINRKEYFEFCKKHITHTIKDIKQIVDKNFRRTLCVTDRLVNIITELNAYAKKSYKQDTRFVIHSVENAINGYSLDSDVIWLYEFDYLF